MLFNNLQLRQSTRGARILGAVPVLRATKRPAVAFLAALLGLTLLTIGCHEHPARTEVPMPSDPLPNFEEALITGTWLLDGDYVQIAHAQSGFELRRYEKNGTDKTKQKIMPFHLARLGDALFFEFEEEATESHPTFYWPCRIDVVDQALQLYCFYLDDLKEKHPEIQLRQKEYENYEEIVDATPEEIRDLYTQYAFDPYVFSQDMTLKRPQPQIVARVERRAVLGNADAQEQLARFYIDADYVGRDRQVAEKWLRRAADQGHAKAQYELAEMLLESGPPDQRDNEEILFWLRKSSERGYAPAFGEAGKLYESGIGVAQDPVHAVQWYQAGAAHGDDVSHCQLGLMHLSGEWIARDERQALSHFVSAVEINSKNEDAWKQIAILRLRAKEQSLRDSALALDAAQRAVAFDPDSEIMEVLAEAQFQNGQFAAAVKTYSELMRVQQRCGEKCEDEESKRTLERYERAAPIEMGGTL